MDYEELYEKPKRDLISLLLNFGEARRILTETVDDDSFECLSKNNIFWDSEDPEVEEKLHALRSRLVWLNQQMYDALEKML